MNVNFLNINNEDKKNILHIIGFGVDKKGIVIDNKTGEPYKCPISQETISLSDAAILPWNSSIVISASALTISEYLSTLPSKCKS